MPSRRRFLALLAAAAGELQLHGLRTQAQTGIFRRKPKPKAPLPQSLVYFGTDTSRPGAGGIYVARFDPNKGRFGALSLAAPCLRPSFMALNEIAPGSQTGGQTGNQTGKTKPQSRHMLYVCNEGDATTSAISTYQLDPASGALTKLGQVSSGGEAPCYIAVDTTGHSAYVADYTGGSVATYAVKRDGTLTQPVDRVDFHNQSVFGKPGPVKDRQDGPHPHSSMLTPDNRFMVVNDLGDDAIALFAVDVSTGHVSKPHLFTSMPPGSGPRHLAFHPNERWAYGVDELANRVDQYLYTAMHAAEGVEAQAVLTAAGRPVSTLDAGYKGVSTAAEVAVAPLGDYLYVSNRGEDTLVAFAIDQTNGSLTFAQRVACGGKTPRHFTLDRSGNWIVCGNQDSASVTVFARDPGSGKLSGPVQTIPLESPMFTLFA